MLVIIVGVIMVLVGKFIENLFSDITIERMEGRTPVEPKKYGVDESYTFYAARSLINDKEYRDGSQ